MVVLLGTAVGIGEVVAVDSFGAGRLVVDVVVAPRFFVFVPGRIDR